MSAPTVLPASPTPADAAALARALLRIGAVRLRPDEPFTWASGRQAPVYTDTRRTLGHPGLRARLAEGFAHAAAPFAPEVIAGTATAGIPHAAWLAARLGLPMAYVRGAAKGHGLRNQIEGASVEGCRVVLVEDLVSTGGSVLEAAEALRAAGAEVVAALAVFTYALPGTAARFAAYGLPLVTLTSFPDLLAAAEADGALAPAALGTLRAWHADWGAEG
ncbi:MAG: orotate phosphoribosyltransferase [Rubricoccaceae bacterium]